jgi:hydrogenase maturation protein HypF
VIELEGLPESLECFRERLIPEAPAAAHIDEVLVEAIPVMGLTSFTIHASDVAGLPRAPWRSERPTECAGYGSGRAPQVRVPPDLAICSDCRREILDEADRREGYPFTNCTACGPRYSIIEAMPYDRSSTAMRFFSMCAACSQEYDDPSQRRFHAQPNACAACAPRVALWDQEGRVSAGRDTAILAAAARLRRGQIVALKGVGGFQLLVRADQADAVQRLRRRKNRPSKPLAVMVPSLAAAEKFALLDNAERHLLNSPQNPIVLAGMRPGTLPETVAPRSGTIGLLLPTTPLHHLLLAELAMPVVATSGNHSEEPIVTREDEALERLAGIADAFLVHDRPIIRGIDDSVARVITGRPVTFRLARGLAPLPLPALEAFAKEYPPMLATGGHQKSAPAVWTGTQAILAQHIGDLDNPAARSTFTEVAHDLSTLYHFEPSALASDLHPDYYSSQWACSQNKPVWHVQHHHAHALACMVEHNLLDREVLALAWDGTGYGPDGTIWGGEVLRGRCTGFQRLASLLPFPLPGGELAIRHPNRAALGLIWLSKGEEALQRDGHLHRLLGLEYREARVLSAMIRRGVNTPWTSSIGRLFDAIAALVLGARETSYEGEAALWLEAVADPAVTEPFLLPICLPAGREPMVGDPALPRGDWRPMLAGILDDLACDVEPGAIAARFHNALAQWAVAVASGQALREVVMSGGCFQNRLLTERVAEALTGGNCRVFLHSQIPPGDGGIAVGQMAAAMAQARQDH